MRIKVGDTFTLSPEYEEWYRKHHAPFVFLFEQGEVLKIDGWHNGTPNEELMIKAHTLDNGIGCGGIPVRFVNLTGGNAYDI